MQDFILISTTEFSVKSYVYPEISDSGQKNFQEFLPTYCVMQSNSFSKNCKFAAQVSSTFIEIFKVTQTLNTSIKDAPVQEIQILASLAGVGRTGCQVHSWKIANLSIL